MILIKITLLGDGAVGKTALRSRFMGEGFTGDYIMTIGADFCVKSIEIGDTKFKFQIWDLAGQPRFVAVRDLYYTGCLGALVLFDLTRPKSYINLTNWIEELWKNNGAGSIPFVLIGNKNDLPYKFPSEYGERYAAQASELTKELGFTIPYLETSAKTGENVEKAFELLAQEILNYVSHSKELGHVYLF
ncbi:MAG: GTP-binding protein [Candidatus Hodarchaeota archaeon]